MLGGECDAVFPSSLLCFTAARWRAKVVVVPRSGHTLMLDVHWEKAAEQVARWLGEQTVVVVPAISLT